jgi:hypothetical protein
VLSREPAHSSAQSETADPGVRHVAGRRGQPVRLGGHIECSQQGTALNPRTSTLRVDTDRTHGGQVDHQPALGHRQPDHAVPTAADPDLQTLATGLGNRDHDVASLPATSNQCRTAVHHRVPHPARLVEPLVARHQELCLPHDLSSSIGRLLGD